MALPHTRRAPQGGRARRPEDAPPLRAVSGTDQSAPHQEADAAGVLPEALARAIKAPAPGAGEDEKTNDPTDPEPQGRAEQPEGEGQELGQGAGQGPHEQVTAGDGGAVAVVEGRSAQDAARALTWLGVTFRPPDVWHERQPSLEEEWRFVMDGSHLPDSEVWKAAARGYAAPAIALISALHLAIWVLRSPARHATAWTLFLTVLITAALML